MHHPRALADTASANPPERHRRHSREPTPRGRSQPGHLIFVTLFGLAVATVVIVAFKVVFALFAGALYALVLRAIAKWIAKVTGVRYGVALGAFVIAGIAVTVGLSLLFAPAIADEASRLGASLPGAVGQVQDQIAKLPVIGHGAGGAAGDLKSKLEPKAVFGAVVGALGGSLEILGGLVVVFFTGVYGAAQPSIYVKAAEAIAPRRHRDLVRRALRASGRNLTRWLLGRLVAMLFVGITTSVAFHFLHVPLAPLLGLLAGLLTFVEYAGAIASAIPPVILAFGQGPGTVLGVVVVYTVLHVIEGYVLTPLLARASVRLPPGVSLGTQALLGTLAGPLGLTFATPLLVVGVSAVQTWREEGPRGEQV